MPELSDVEMERELEVEVAEQYLEALFESLANLLPEEADEIGLYDVDLLQGARVRTLDRAGYLTRDRGLEVKLRNGETLILTIQVK